MTLRIPRIGPISGTNTLPPTPPVPCGGSSHVPGSPCFERTPAGVWYPLSITYFINSGNLSQYTDPLGIISYIHTGGPGFQFATYGVGGVPGSISGSVDFAGTLASSQLSFHIVGDGILEFQMLPAAGANNPNITVALTSPSFQTILAGVSVPRIVSIDTSLYPSSHCERTFTVTSFGSTGGTAIGWDYMSFT